MEARKTVVPVQLANGATLHVAASILGDEAEVTSRVLSFQQVMDTLEGITTALMGVVHKVKPQKARVEFGLEVAVEAGQLTALLVQGTGAAHFQITMDWEE